MDIEDGHIGRRVREVRAWRGQSLSAVAGLAGMSTSYLSLIERGLRPVTRQAVLEALANALRVSPEELTGQPYQAADALSRQARVGIAAVESALDAYDLGIDPEVPYRPWPELSLAVEQLNTVLREDADYAGLGAAIPGLLAELHATYVHEPKYRREALIGLIYAYRSAAGFTKCLGVRGLPMVAARLAQGCADELAEPAWIGFTTFMRGYAAGALNRPHQYSMAVRSTEELSPHFDNPDVIQAAGALHLNAALVCAAQGNAELARDHVTEATELANRLPDDVGNFGWLHFRPENVGIWKTSLGTELGEGAKVAEYAKAVHPAMIEGKARKAAFLADVGRALTAEKRTRERGIQVLAEAERTAPQLIRNNPYVRDLVSSQLVRARRDAGSRELRGLAYRMGVAPKG